MNVDEAARRAGGTIVDTKDGPRVQLRGVTLALFPGGEVTLGWDGARTTLDDLRRKRWSEGADTSQSFEEVLRELMGPTRTVTLAPFLIETTTESAASYIRDDAAEDLEAHVRSVVEADGFRLLTNDEWEAAARAGSTTLFAWGDEWPDGEPWADNTRWTKHLEPNPLGLVLGSNPYQPEVTSDGEWLRRGDGGVALCGGRPSPEAWAAFAHAYQYPRTLWEDVVTETYEEARVRRGLSIPTGP